MSTASEAHGEVHKRKAGDVAEEDMKDKKNKTGKEEERGAKRSVDEWEEYAKRQKTSADEREKEARNQEKEWTSARPK